MCSSRFLLLQLPVLGVHMSHPVEDAKAVPSRGHSKEEKKVVVDRSLFAVPGPSGHYNVKVREFLRLHILLKDDLECREAEQSKDVRFIHLASVHVAASALRKPDRNGSQRWINEMAAPIGSEELAFVSMQ